MKTFEERIGVGSFPSSKRVKRMNFKKNFLEIEI